MLEFLMSAFLLLTHPAAFAHEGHDHGPGSIQAPKGGVMRSLETVNLEFLLKGKTVTIYLYDTAMKPLEVEKYQASVMVEFPRKKPQAMKLEPKNDHWTVEVDPKGAHRYTVELSIKQGGHEDKVKFTAEPKK